MKELLKNKGMKIIFCLFLIGLLVGWIYLTYNWFSGVYQIPSSINIGPLKIRLYSFSILLGAIGAYIFALYRAKWFSIPASVVDDLLFLGIPTGIIGTRLAYVLQNWSYFRYEPLKILFIWEGGLSLHGGLIGAVILLLVYTRVKKLSPWKVGDAFALTLFLAEGIGRWGNFFNQELIGYPTNFFLKMFISPAYRPWGYEIYSYYHPAFLYQSLFSFAFLFLLLFLEKKNLLREGESLLGFFFLQSLGRFLVEFIRIEPRIFANLSLAQLVCLGIMFLTGVIIIGRRKGVKLSFKRAKKELPD